MHNYAAAAATTAATQPINNQKQMLKYPRINFNTTHIQQ